MSSMGHNGGPPVADDVPDMAYVKFFPGDFLNGTAHMSLELRGAYITTLCVMYDRMGGFPYDEHEGGVLLRVDKRVYRRVRDALLADGKFYRDGDLIRNARVDREIASYVTEYRRRSEAAKKREAERAKEREAELAKQLELHSTSGELPPNLSRTSGELPAEVKPKSFELDAKNSTKTTNEEAQADHIPEARSQKPEARYKKEREEEVGLGLPAPVAAATPAKPQNRTDAQIAIGVEVLAAFQAYNALAQDVGLPVAKSLTPSRRRSMMARMREHGGVESWQALLNNIQRSAFLQGRNDRGWVPPGLDWFLKPANFTKVVEGAYGNGAHAKPHKETEWERMDRLMRGGPINFATLDVPS